MLFALPVRISVGVIVLFMGRNFYGQEGVVKNAFLIGSFLLLLSACGPSYKVNINAARNMSEQEAWKNIDAYSMKVKDVLHGGSVQFPCMFDGKKVKPYKSNFAAPLTDYELSLYGDVVILKHHSIGTESRLNQDRWCYVSPRVGRKGPDISKLLTESLIALGARYTP